ncbi:hypothetical protein BpHYR1_046978 [Brachionus plicatilis]|uniref:Uncharacterized protein n=1 Tax=Brachionus plicatilis TaxID=10195 RepID=A0A3M7SDB5_BRAPC|nr:hypothetical protein BpHYR1_046978 [Brachionus plicatilis]
MLIRACQERTGIIVQTSLLNSHSHSKLCVVNQMPTKLIFYVDTPSNIDNLAQSKTTTSMYQLMVRIFHIN